MRFWFPQLPRGCVMFVQTTQEEYFLFVIELSRGGACPEIKHGNILKTPSLSLILSQHGVLHADRNMRLICLPACSDAVFYQRCVFCRRATGSPLHNEGPGCPPDDAAPAGVFLRLRQTKGNDADEQTGMTIFKYLLFIVVYCVLVFMIEWNQISIREVSVKTNNN